MKADRIWSEDDVLLHDPEHVTLQQKWMELFGETFDGKEAVEFHGHGDHMVFHMPNGYIATVGAEGSEILRPKQINPRKAVKRLLRFASHVEINGGWSSEEAMTLEEAREIVDDILLILKEFEFVRVCKKCRGDGRTRTPDPDEHSSVPMRRAGCKKCGGLGLRVCKARMPNEKIPWITKDINLPAKKGKKEQ